jgi:hypothetical protein
MKGRQSIVVLALALFAPLCHANDFPTAGRVEFVLECMRDHSGGQFELLNKCSCTIDRLAGHYRYDRFVEAQTMAKAVTIAGERGSTLRDNEEAQKAAKRYRASVAEAAHACFLR